MLKFEAIAEVGINHNGSVDTGRKLIDAVAEAGFSSIKFQTYDPDTRFNPGNPFIEVFRGFWLSPENEFKLWLHAKEIGLRLYTTPFDEHCLAHFDSQILDGLKIASFETSNLRLVRAVAAFGKRTLFSLGQNSEDDFASILESLGGNLRTDQIVPMHCVSAYPHQESEAHINVVRRLRSNWPGQLGYSDHTTSPFPAALALASGATVFEKHVTLDHSMSGPDHSFSADPAEMVDYVSTLNRAAAALGSDSIRVRESEKFINAMARRESE